jgi:8-oxo-dGTP diphosphatase
MQPPDHELQMEIIRRLMYSPQQGFNELWAKYGKSNAFAYHVNKLEELGYIEKIGEKYSLTQEGKKLTAFIEGATGKRSVFPTFSVIMMVRRNGKYVCCERRKEPFYGYWSHPAGKIQFGENPEECATRELREETGLIADTWVYKGMQIIKTYEEDNLLYHHYIMFMHTDDVTGELITESREGQNAWLTHEEFHEKKAFPGGWYSDIIEPSPVPIILEGIRRMKNGEFVGVEITAIHGAGHDAFLKTK